MADRVVRVVLRGQVEGFVAGMSAAGRAVRDTTRDLTAAEQRAAQYRTGLSTVGRTAGTVGLAAAVSLGAVVLAAANFDEAMSKVQAATHETSSNMEELREAAISAAAATSYSASEAAGAIEALAKAGVSTKDILAGGLSGALNLAASDGIAVADAAEIAASALSQFNLAGEQTTHVADLLAAGAGKAQGGVGQLGAALSQSGLVAAQTGLSIEETVGALSEFAHAGLIGSDAGTSFKTMLQALNPNSKQAAEAMADLGISAYDAQGNFVGMTQFADNLRNGLKGLSVEQQNATLKTIFGSDAVRAAAVIFNDGAEGVAKWQGKVDDAGYAAETAALRLDNLKGDVEKLKGSLETAFIGGGEGSQGMLRGLVQGTTDVVNGLNAIPEPAKRTASALLAITAVTGGSLWFGTKVIGGITATRGALAALGLQAGTTRAALSSLGTVGATAAIGIGTVLDQLSLLDSRSRSGDAAKATIKNFQDLSDALSRSNVGKYADDLHINLDRLAQDLLENGKSGSYATKVFDDLAEHSHGAGAAVNSLAGNVLPFFTANADKAYDANKDLNAIVGKSGAVLGSAAKQTATLADGTQFLGTQAEITTQQLAVSEEVLKKLRDQAGETAAEFFGLGKSVDDSKVSLDEWIKDLEKQRKALENFTKNAKKATRRGLNEGLIQELEGAGPAGALRLKELANATDAEIGRANRAWRRGQKAIEEYIAYVTRASDVKLTIDADQAAAAIRRIKAELLSLPKTVRTQYYVTQTTRVNKTSGGGQDGDPSTPYAEGGYTGPGGRMEPRGVVHAGEVVWSQDDVQAWGGPGAVDTMRQSRDLPGFADGGDVSGRSTTSSGRGGYGSVKSELHDYRKAIRQSTSAIEKETSKRDDLVSKQNDLITAVTSAFTRDIFGSKPEGYAWMSAEDRNQAQVGDPLEILQQDIANATAFQKQLQTLTTKGLDGGAYAELAATGDLDRVTAYAALTPAQLAQYESLFNQRAQVSGDVGKYAGTSAFGKDISAMNGHLKSMNARGARLEAIERRLEKLAKDNPHATGKAVGRAINGAAPKRRS